ncbi:MAG: sugar phosphate nucleotidyltransferase [Desulfobacterales bacterium]|jgi:aminoglycoside/choline kinase family phosphotransferase/dTDP-glucose pyrophosphorylase
MKALILAAGLGKRLQPYTDHTPKPLFSIQGRPLLDIMIFKLIVAGCKAVIINTHHLHEQIESFIAQQTYPIPIQTRYEPDILGTGGAIKNVADFWNHRPFMVVNADIVTTIDFKKVYDFHCQHPHPATLVLADDPEFNTVAFDTDGFVTIFHQIADAAVRPPDAALTFTGIQVLDPEFLDYIPVEAPSSSIDVYARMMAKGKKIRAYISEKSYWKDIGDAERYKSAVFETMAPAVFGHVFPNLRIGPIEREHLKGDGSDRQWYRLKMGEKSMILVDHGIKKTDRVNEAEAFVNIGRHLFEKNLPVPQIYDGDTFAGYAFLEDLGNLDLQTTVQQTDNSKKIIGMYRSVIQLLINFSTLGAERFDAAWTYQTPGYSKALILEKECRYFVDAFLNTYLGLEILYEDFKKEFEFLAEKALEHALPGLMHRDFQSRNIMIKNDEFYFIDFQASRMGPIQYDLAALLIDPYVQLPQNIQTQLLGYCVEKLQAEMNLNADNFCRCYRYCRLTRNLQMLGAFGYLSHVKGKAHFENYIPAAVQTLKRNLNKRERKTLPALNALVDKILVHNRIQNLVRQATSEKNEY